jgi:hypothetical protein
MGAVMECFEHNMARAREADKARIAELEAILRDITYENAGQVHVGYREYVDLAEKWPALRDLHLQKSA